MSNEEESKIDKIKLDDGTTVTDQCRPSSKNPQWTVIREVGRGAFGAVYQVVKEGKSRREAALKIETIEMGDNQLKLEREVMKAQRTDPLTLQVLDAGVFNTFRFIVMTLCGPDLEKLAVLMNWKYDKTTVLRVGIRTLCAVKKLHEMEYVHRDLKPANFAIDYNPSSLSIYLLDCGMARRYARRIGKKYIIRRPREAGLVFRGSTQYCSMEMHKGREVGRVDDLWSWLYMTMEMVAPLPWNGIRLERAALFQKETSTRPYIDGNPFLKSTFGETFEDFVKLKYENRPKYEVIFDRLYKKLKEIGGQLSGPMEWDSKRAVEEEKEKEAKLKLGLEWKPPTDTKAMEDEETVKNYLTEEFYREGVPDGTKRVLQEKEDFFGDCGLTLQTVQMTVDEGGTTCEEGTKMKTKKKKKTTRKSTKPSKEQETTPLAREQKTKTSNSKVQKKADVKKEKAPKSLDGKEKAPKSLDKMPKSLDKMPKTMEAKTPKTIEAKTPNSAEAKTPRNGGSRSVTKK